VRPAGAARSCNQRRARVPTGSGMALSMKSFRAPFRRAPATVSRRSICRLKVTRVSSRASPANTRTSRPLRKKVGGAPRCCPPCSWNRGNSGFSAGRCREYVCIGLPSDGHRQHSCIRDSRLVPDGCAQQKN
jgi:hypothetical protein